jgi:lysine biosynthesis protein LysW
MTKMSQMRTACNRVDIFFPPLLHIPALYYSPSICLARAQEAVSSELCERSVGALSEKGVIRVTDHIKAQIVMARCPDCGESIRLVASAVRVGRKVVCFECDADLEVIQTDPVTLDWIYENENEDEDEW